jgi:hypothetical protein
MRSPLQFKPKERVGFALTPYCVQPDNYMKYLENYNPSMTQAL